MTQDEIIRMALEACAPNQTFNSDEEWVKRFAALVAAHEREACAKESLEVLNNLREETIAQCQKGMIEAYKLGQSEEREACAKVCDERKSISRDVLAKSTAGLCAAAIRARSKHG